MNRANVDSARTLGYGARVTAAGTSPMPAPRKLGKPLITANQVTMARLALLPLGCYLLYLGRDAQWVALVAMTIVGCTDFVDGWLARKYGPTVLGGLMDPIADKMFVALTMLPALDLGWLPTVIVALIFLREFVITAARTAYSRRDVELKTSFLAKVKTWYQMIVIGLLFLLVIDMERPSGDALIVRTMILIGFLIAVGAAILSYAIKRRVWKGTIAFMLSLGIIYFIIRGIPQLGWEAMSAVTMRRFLGWITVAITWASGGAYLAGIRDLPGTARFDRNDAVRLFGAVVLPILGCVLIGKFGLHGHTEDPARMYVPAWPVFVTIALEFAIGGLDNLLSVQKKLGDWRAWALRVAVQAGFLGGALAAAIEGGSPVLAYGLTLGALCVTAAFTIYTFTVNRHIYLAAADEMKPESEVPNL